MSSLQEKFPTTGGRAMHCWHITDSKDAYYPFGVVYMLLCLPECHLVPVPYLLAAKMSKDAVLAYHTAWEFYGKAYSIYEQFYYLAKRKSLPVNFRSYEFRGSYSY
jgi:hypothetical protein